jgi:hypothetical protein
MSEWRWKDKDRAATEKLRLLYEPGSWGDLLKSAAAVEVARALLVARRPLRVLDPFAGAPTYPLVEPARARLERLPGSALALALAPFAARSELASTGRLVLALGEPFGRGAVQLATFDRDGSRRIAWEALDGATWLDVASGWDALAREADLAIVDPYDLVAEWRERLGELASAAERADVLAYLYNRSPRGASQFRDYEQMRKALAKARGKAPLAVLRAPSDAVLPRAYHEVIFLPRATRVRREARDLARRVARAARPVARAARRGGEATLA